MENMEKDVNRNEEKNGLGWKGRATRREGK